MSGGIVLSSSVSLPRIPGPGCWRRSLYRGHRISEATNTWRKKYGGIEVSEARRLKSLEDENAKLKRLLADAMLDISTLREKLGRKLPPGARRYAVLWAIDNKG